MPRQETLQAAVAQQIPQGDRLVRVLSQVTTVKLAQLCKVEMEPHRAQTMVQAQAAVAGLAAVVVGTMASTTAQAAAGRVLSMAPRQIPHLRRVSDRQQGEHRLRASETVVARIRRESPAAS